MGVRRLLYVLAVSALVLSLLVEDVDARRKVLRGRKAITRQYYKGTAIPAWSIAFIVGLCMLGIGGGAYALLGKAMIRHTGAESAV